MSKCLAYDFQGLLQETGTRFTLASLEGLLQSSPLLLRQVVNTKGHMQLRILPALLLRQG